MFYFAYGSNMNENQMNNRCPENQFIGIATLQGYRLDYTRFAKTRCGGVADIVADSGGTVWGLVFKLTPQDFDLLDGFEGRGKAYDRMTVPVRFLDDRVIEAETYFVIDKQGPFAPGEEYLALLVSAAKKHQFPAEYVSRLAEGKGTGDQLGC